MQATSRTRSDASASAPVDRAPPPQQRGWYLAFALLTTLAEALFLLSSMPSWMLG